MELTTPSKTHCIGLHHSFNPEILTSMEGEIVGKGGIGLGCVRIKATQVQALVQDCKTDVVFDTLSLLFPLVGEGIGMVVGARGRLLSLFITYDLGHTCLDNVVRLSREAADDRTYRKPMYPAYRFSPLVEYINNITPYHAGDGVWAEFDILLDEQSRLNSLMTFLRRCSIALRDWPKSTELLSQQTTP